MIKTALLGMTALASFAGAASAQATLLGDSLSGAYYFPDLATLYGNYTLSPSTFVVGAGSESLGTVDGVTMDIDFSDDMLVITMPQVIFTGGAFNGFVFTNLTDAFAPILSFSGVAPSLMGGGTMLALNWQGVSFAAGDQVIVNFGTVVPEPASWAMMIAGLAIVGLAMRRNMRGAKVSFA
jgi:hypothetical protein